MLQIVIELGWVVSATTLGLVRTKTAEMENKEAGSPSKYPCHVPNAHLTVCAPPLINKEEGSKYLCKVPPQRKTWNCFKKW